MIDEEGSSTRRTVDAAKELRADQSGSALLVSSPYHMHRISREARRQGLPAVCCSAPTTPIMQHPRTLRRQMLREVAATWWYAAAGWQRRRRGDGQSTDDAVVPATQGTTRDLRGWRRSRLVAACRTRWRLM
jgi:hypothetical protein